MAQKIKMFPSQFVEKYIKISRALDFSFTGREYFLPIYNSNSEIELFKTGRQMAKSTFLSNRIITRSSLMSGLQVLYEAPREEQSKTFSRQKLAPALLNSPKLRPFLKMDSKGNIVGKSILTYDCFKSQSFIKLSTTFNGVDRDRGITINDLYIDEVQDQLDTDIAIIAEGMSAQAIRYTAYAGTPKTYSNYIEKLWRDSTQYVWHVRCDPCNTWQVPGIENIFPDGLLCKKCHRRLNVLNGCWVQENPGGRWNGWHISQLMRLVKGLPGAIKWKSPDGLYGIYDKFQLQSPATFHNEVLGLSYDSAEKPIVLADLKNIELPDFKAQEKFDSRYFTSPVIMGIDWGKGNTAYTVVSITMMFRDKPVLVYMKRFTGAESDPDQTALIIENLYKKFCCSSIYCDNGLFWHFEPAIRKRFGNTFVNDNFHFIQYWQNNTQDLILRSFANSKNFYKVSRNEIMNLFVNHIKQKKINIYNFKEFAKENFHQDYLAVSYEIRESKDRGERLFFMTSGENEGPTDCFHSHVYSWLGLSLELGLLKAYLEDPNKKDKNRELFF